MVGCFDDLVQVDDIGVSHFFHDLYFPLNAYLIILILDWFFVNDLYGYFLSCGDVDAFFDLAKSTPTKSMSHLIVSDTSW